MQSLKTKAIVLRRTNYGEADRILQVITPHHGKLGVIAKGVRRQKSKSASAVELFCQSDFVIAKGRGELGVLTSARLEISYKHIIENYERLQFGYTALQRIGKISEHVSESPLYELAVITLTALNDLSIDLRIIQAWFYLHAAELEGHGLNLSRDVNNSPLKAESRYHFDINEMSFVEQPGGSFTAEHLKLLKIMKLKNPQLITRISGIGAYLDECLRLAHVAGE